MLKQKFKGLIKVLILGGIMSSLSSCLIMSIARNEINKKPMVNSERIDPQDFASPKNHTLVFFTLDEVGFLSDGHTKAYLLQIDPKYKPCIMNAGKLSGGLTVFAPMSVGMDMHIYRTIRSVADSQGTTTYYNHFPLGSTSDLTMRFKAKKPGLQYIGKYKAEDNNYVYVDSKNELLALNKLKDYVKGTEWEIVVEDRIKELTK